MYIELLEGTRCPSESTTLFLRNVIDEIGLPWAIRVKKTSIIPSMYSVI